MRLTNSQLQASHDIIASSTDGMVSALTLAIRNATGYCIVDPLAHPRHGQPQHDCRAEADAKTLVLTGACEAISGIMGICHPQAAVDTVQFVLEYLLLDLHKQHGVRLDGVLVGSMPR